MSNISRHPDCKHRNEIGNCLIVGGFCTAVPTSVCEAERRKDEVIRAICDNGYDGILIPGFSLLIRYNGKEVLHTYSPKPKTYDELMEVLETMPQFMDMLREQEHGK